MTFQTLFFSKQFIKFLVAGGLAATINFSSRFIYSTFVDFSLAVILAFCTGLASGYVLAKLYVFGKSQNTTRQEIALYILINLLALIQTWVISILLANYMLATMVAQNLSEGIAHFVGVISPVFTSFIGHKYLTFRQKL